MMFDDYIKSVCKCVRSERKKAEIEEELLSHLMEAYNQNIAVGMDDMAAQENAIECMGDKEKLKNQFAALYSISPPDYMRSSINFLIFGILFTYFHLDFFAGAGKIQAFFGEMLILYGLFKIREINKSLKKAFYIFPLLLLYENMSLFIREYFYPDDSIIEFLLLSPIALHAFFYGFLFFGLSGACNAVKTENDKRPHPFFCYINILFFLLILAMAVYAGDSEAFIILIIPFIIPLLGLWRVKRILGRKEPEFDLSYTLSKRDKRSYGVFVVFFLILPIFIMIISATRKPETHIFSPVDTTESVETVQSAREHMLDLGFPQEYLDDLPDSEVLRYRTASYCEESSYYSSKEIGKIIKIYIFYFSAEYDKRTEEYVPSGDIRTLYRIELPDDSKANYKNGFYAHFAYQDFVLVYGDNGVCKDERDGMFFTALSDKDGTTILSDPFKTYRTGTNNFYSRYTGAEYAFADKSTNRRAYLADTAVVSHPGITQYVSVAYEYYYKDIPLYVTYNSFSEAANTTLGQGYIGPDGRQQDPTIHKISNFHSFKYDSAHSFTTDEPVADTEE